MLYIPSNTSLMPSMKAWAAGLGSAAFLLLLFCFGEPGLRATNPTEERIIALIEPTASGLGFRIVRVRVSGNRRKRLQIMSERVSDGHMGIDDCSRLSRALAPVFDLEDPIKDEYDLEISSPGIDRPLMRIEDFERFKGHVAKCETAAMINGQRRFKGEIAAIEGQTIVLVTEQGETRLEFSALSDARLVLTDQLIEEDLKRAKAAERNSSPASGGGPEHSEGEGASLSTDGAAPLSPATHAPKSVGPLTRRSEPHEWLDSSPRDREAIPSKDDPLAKRAGGGGAKDKRRNNT